MARVTPPKSPVVSKKKQSGCMWGLYSLFAFHQGRSDRKLLSYRKGSKKHAVGKSFVSHCSPSQSPLINAAVVFCIGMALVAMGTKKKEANIF